MNPKIKSEAIKNLVGGNYHMNADYSIEYMSGQTPPTEETIQAEMDRLEARDDANQYQRDRAVSFPSIGDQLDMQYWDQVNNTTTWKDAVAKVKSDNPK